ncbi:MAG: hypothetical protein ACUVXG_07805 [Anaerolineae bacterium]
MPALYVVNWEAISQAIFTLQGDGINVAAWRFRLFVALDPWFQWLALAVSAVIVVLSIWRYMTSRSEKTLLTERLPRWLYLFRVCLVDIPVAYMISMTVVNAFDFIAALNRVLTNIPTFVTVDALHPDGLYGLRPAYNLLLGQLATGLLLSFVPLLILRREAQQWYAWQYKAATTVGIAITIGFALAVLANFNRAIDQVRFAEVASIVGRLHSSQAQQPSLLEEVYRANLLAEYQIAVSLPSSIPIPGWLQALGTSRLLLLAGEAYSLLQPVLGTPKIPDVLRRAAK